MVSVRSGLQESAEVSHTPVQSSPVAATQRVEELYECDAGGSIIVTVADQSSGYSRTYRLGRWSQQSDSKPLKPASRRKKNTGTAAAASN